MDTIFNYIKNKKFNDLFEFIKKNKDIDLDLYDENYNYVIQYLVMFNEIEIINYILNYNYNIRLDVLDNDGRNLLFMPIKYNYYELLKILLENDKKNVGVSLLDVRDNFGYTGLHYCIIYDNIKALNLIKNDMIINAEIYNLCLQHKRTNIFLFLLENEIKKPININNFINNNGESILQSAINYDDMKAVRFIINNTNFVKHIINNQEKEYGLTALQQCIVLNHNDIIIKLIENDSSINMDINLGDYLGNTPLHYSIIEKNYQIAELFLSNNSKNVFYSATNMNGNTPLHIFLEEDINLNSPYQINILLKLIENTDINIINMDGNTALHYSCISVIQFNKSKKRR
jgi:ankyrin repeat protein